MLDLIKRNLDSIQLINQFYKQIFIQDSYITLFSRSSELIQKIIQYYCYSFWIHIYCHIFIISFDDKFLINIIFQSYNVIHLTGIVSALDHKIGGILHLTQLSNHCFKNHGNLIQESKFEFNILYHIQWIFQVNEIFIHKYIILDNISNL